MGNNGTNNGHCDGFPLIVSVLTRGESTSVAVLPYNEDDITAEEQVVLNRVQCWQQQRNNTPEVDPRVTPSVQSTPCNAQEAHRILDRLGVTPVNESVHSL